MNDVTRKTIGEALGVFLRTGKDRQGSCLGSFLRLRVGIDVGLPLIKGVAFTPEGWQESKLLDVDYEHLPHFCFFCGLLSHTGNSCPARLEGTVTEPLYDALLNSERKDEWLARRRLEPSDLVSSGGTEGGRRFGLIPKKQSGWSMSAPNFPMAGVVRSRAEMEEEGTVPLEAIQPNDMEVDRREGEASCFATLSKRRKTLSLVADGLTSAMLEKGPPALTSEPVLQLMDVPILECSDLNASLLQSLEKGNLFTSLAVVQQKIVGVSSSPPSLGEDFSPTKAMTVFGNSPGEHHGNNSIINVDSFGPVIGDQAGSSSDGAPEVLEHSRIFSMRNETRKLSGLATATNKGGRQRAMSSPPSPQPTPTVCGNAENKKKKGFVVRKSSTIVSPSSIMSSGRTSKRLSVMGPASTHHAS
ncbi:hypothetical protein M0R45_018357 [Rubus argutus]|uniref:Zinc knuckle CX2CX4HX4C domain-containing protein n=1 Tax=Rubus argutus TaxID=59490 RepID=A0AAW1X4U2_RUBAR